METSAAPETRGPGLPPPHVAVDLLASRSGGALNYTRNLMPLLRERGRFRYTLVLRPSQRAAFGFERGDFDEVAAPEATLRPLTRLAWGQAVLPPLLRARGVDLLFAPTDHPPLWVPCPLVMAVRNPTPYTEVATVQGLGRRGRERIMRLWTRVAAHRARRVIFVSQAAADRINAYLRIPPERLRVVHHGLDPVIAAGRRQELDLDLPSDFVLAVSSFYLYKNYLGLVRALAALRDRQGVEVPLVVCGREIDRQNVARVREEVARLGIPVRFLGEVGPGTLATLYRQARVFAFPSYLETFGHPLVEAMAAGTPVAAGDIPTSRELCGDAACYFDPHEPRDIARALWELWSDSALRAKLRERGWARSQGFSWARCAERTEEVLDEALRPLLATGPDLR